MIIPLFTSMTGNKELALFLLCLLIIKKKQVYDIVNNVLPLNSPAGMIVIPTKGTWFMAMRIHLASLSWPTRLLRTAVVIDVNYKI